MMANKLTKGSNVRWESSFMLPEFVQALQEHAFEKTKVPRPILDEQEIEELNRTIAKSINHRDPIQLKYFDCGFIKEIVGFIRKFDEVNHVLYINDMDGLLRYFNRIDILGAKIEEKE